MSALTLASTRSLHAASDAAWQVVATFRLATALTLVIGSFALARALFDLSHSTTVAVIGLVTLPVAASAATSRLCDAAISRQRRTR